MKRPEHPLFQQAWPTGDFSFFQMGFVVDDLIEAADAWSRVFGVGPFSLLPASEQTWTYRGEPSQINIQVGVSWAGPVQIELIKQWCDRPSIFREAPWNDRKGFHQICTVTPDYEGKKAHYLSLGYELAAEITAPSVRVGYFDTSADFGFFTEVAEGSDAFLRQLAGLARGCATWDGQDPVRLLTRDGYRVPEG